MTFPGSFQEIQKDRDRNSGICNNGYSLELILCFTLSNKGRSTGIKRVEGSKLDIHLNKKNGDQ